MGDLVGEGVSERWAVVGETPNLAARLQSIAEPNSVVIGPRTKRLARSGFNYVDLGLHELKGIPMPVPQWRRCLQQLANGICRGARTHLRRALQAGYEALNEGLRQHGWIEVS